MKYMETRSSSYNIYVKVDKDNNLYAILNSYTRVFDIVNNDVYTYLVSDGERGQISVEAKQKLIERGYLTALTEDEETALVKRILDTSHDRIRLKDYGFQFILSYDCNLRCVYCYEDKILNGVNCLNKQLISKAQIDKAFDFITEKWIENPNCSKHIALYGGEPFLRSNWEAVTYLIKKGSELGCSFSATSNGYDLDYYFDFLKEYNKISFQITLDGIAEIHNARKPHYCNKDSFEKISNNVGQLLEMGINVSIRINSDAYSINRIEELSDFFREKGWLEKKNFRAYCALLREEIGTTEGSNVSLSPLSQSGLYDIYKAKIERGRLDSRIDFQNYGIKRLLLGMLENKPIPYRGCFCGAQSANMIFDPLGDIYTCWDMVGHPEHRIGTYYPEFKLEENGVEKWYGLEISNYKCVKCPYVLFCLGGCPVRSLYETNRIEPGYCNDYPRLFGRILKEIYVEKIRDKLQ